MTERLQIGNGGWIRWSGAGFPAEIVQIRFRRGRGGRLVIGELYTVGDQPLEGRMLRRLPLGAIETWANGPGNREAIEARLDIPGPDLRQQADTFATTFGTSSARSPQLSVPAASPYPTSFYRQVAEKFAAGIPAGVLAAANDVPVSTVYRWIKEARDRGLMPRARRVAVAAKGRMRLRGTAKGRQIRKGKGGGDT